MKDTSTSYHLSSRLRRGIESLVKPDPHIVDVDLSFDRDGVNAPKTLQSPVRCKLLDGLVEDRVAEVMDARESKSTKRCRTNRSPVSRTRDRSRSHPFGRSTAFPARAD